MIYAAVAIVFCSIGFVAGTLWATRWDDAEEIQDWWDY